MGRDRLDWIFTTDGDQSLESRYDNWSSTYDDDHDDWGWRGPQRIAETFLRLAGGDLEGPVVDAGCGTGRAGAALRQVGYSGRLIGFDLSQGMLDAARGTGVYDELTRASLDDVPMLVDSVTGIVSSGVFTHGHVGGSAFAELCRVAQPRSIISITQRIDLRETYEPFAVELVDAGTWALLDVTTPESFHPTRDESDQVVMSWQVR